MFFCVTFVVLQLRLCCLRHVDDSWLMRLVLSLHARMELTTDSTFFCRDFMHIVLVHYLEVKVIANPTLVDMYLATCPLYFQKIGFHHPKCCIVEKFMLNAFFSSLRQVLVYYLL